jgi:hypothetical protein
VKTHDWFLIAVALVIAGLLRYLVPSQYGLSFRSGGAVRGVPINSLMFWLILAAAGIVILVKVVAALARR